MRFSRHSRKKVTCDLARSDHAVLVEVGFTRFQRLEKIEGEDAVAIGTHIEHGLIASPRSNRLTGPTVRDHFKEIVQIRRNWLTARKDHTTVAGIDDEIEMFSRNRLGVFVQLFRRDCTDDGPTRITVNRENVAPFPVFRERQGNAVARIEDKDFVVWSGEASEIFEGLKDAVTSGLAVVQLDDVSRIEPVARNNQVTDSFRIPDGVFKVFRTLIVVDADNESPVSLEGTSGLPVGR